MSDNLKTSLDASTTESVPLELPEIKVEKLETEGLQIEIQRLIGNMLKDQGSGMIAGDGCIHSPGGPTC